MARKSGAFRVLSVLSLLIIVSMLVSAVGITPALAQEKKLTVGVQVPTLANPFWVNYMNFMQQVAGELNIELKISDVQNREDEQISDLESLIAGGVDGLVLVPQTAEVGPKLLQKAEDAKVPVVIPDRWPGVEPGDPKYTQYVAFIGPNDEKAGYDICAALVEAGAKNLVAVSGFHGASVHEGRSKGMHKCVEEKGIKLLDEQWVGETRDKGMALTENYLSRFPGPGFDGVWHLNDDTAMGTIQALEAAGVLDKVKVGGMDLNPDAVKSLKAGKYTYSTGGHWLQGGFGLLMLFDWINGVKPTERVVRLNLMGVTAATVAKFEEKFITNPPKYDIKSMSRFYNPDAKTYFEISLEDKPAPAPTKKLTVGVQVPTLANPFWVNYMNFMQQVAGELNIELKISDVQNREDKQISDLESLIAGGVDGLVLVPQTAEVGPKLLQKAEDAKVPVVIPDRWPGVEPGDPKYTQYVAFIGPNDEKAGYDICAALVEAGAKNLVAVSGFHGASVHEGRSKGMHKCVEEKGIKLLDEQWVGETRDKGMALTENYLSRFPGPGFDGVWHLNDDTAMGTIQALEAAGVLDKVKVGGMDLNPDAVKSLKAGKYTYSTGGHWLQGGFGLLMLFDWINGVKPTERVVRLNLMGVTAATVAKFEEKFITNPPKYDIKSMSRFYNPDAKTYFEISLQ